MANQFLYTVPYKELSSWSYGLLVHFDRDIFKFPTEKLGCFLKKYENKADLISDTVFTRITIKTKGQGVVKRDEAFGKDIKTQGQFYVRAGQFIYSNIDARNGAFGVVPKNLDMAIITNSFTSFECDETKLLPQYLVLLLSTPYYVSIFEKISVGTTNRRSVKPEALLNIKIPIPPIEKQQELVDDYNSAIKYAEAIKQARLSAISDYFIKELLPYNYEVSSIKKLFGTISLKEIDRWDVWNQLTNVKSNKYQVVPFGRVIIGKPQYGANTPGVDKKCDFRYIRITDINENGTLNNDIVFPKDVEKQYILHEDDFLIARSGNTVGKTFLYKESFGDAIYAGYLVRYIINKQLANPEYLFFYSKTIMYQNWVKKNQRISGQPNINGQEYLAVPIILPDLGKQQEMVNMSKLIQQDVVSQVRQSEILVRQAKQNFENAIFN